MIYGDTLSDDGTASLPKATLILTNPPFGTKKGGGLPTRDDFTFPTSNKQFCLLAAHLPRPQARRPRRRGAARQRAVREQHRQATSARDLMDKCNLHTILRLPTGIFYAQGVKTNVLFFTRGETDKGNTKEVWVYDMRANMPQFGKRTPFTRDHFRTASDAPANVARDKFEDVFGDDPLGGAAALALRVDTGEAGRWRKFTRERSPAWRQPRHHLAQGRQRRQRARSARRACRGGAAGAARTERRRGELRALLEELGEDPDLLLDELLPDVDDLPEVSE